MNRLQEFFRRVFRGWNLFELCWLGTFVLLSVILTILTKDSLIGFFAFLFGIICVVLTAKGNVWSYVYGYVNIILYAYLCWRNGLYGEMGLNLFFFLPTGIIGFILWRRNIQKSGALVMRKLSWRGNGAVAALCVLGTLATGWGLSWISGQNTPYIDALTNVLSIMATFLMIWRFREQWLLYMTLNAFTILMWTIRLYNGSPDAPLMIVMWSAYLINACYGFYNWTKGANKALEKS